jgi:hypothetical protein
MEIEGYLIYENTQELPVATSELPLLMTLAEIHKN